MERAARPIIPAFALERKVARDNVDYVGRFANALDDFITVKCHAHKIRKVRQRRQGLSAAAQFCAEFHNLMKQGCAITYHQSMKTQANSHDLRVGMNVALSRVIRVYWL